MAEKLDPKEVVAFKELLKSNVYEQEALVNLWRGRGSLLRPNSWRKLHG